MGDMKLSARLAAGRFSCVGNAVELEVRVLEQALEKARAGRDKALADRIPFTEAYTAPITRERDALRTELTQVRMEASLQQAQAAENGAMRDSLYRERNALKAELAAVKAERDVARLAALKECADIARWSDVGHILSGIQVIIDAEESKVET